MNATVIKEETLTELKRLVSEIEELRKQIEDYIPLDDFLKIEEKLVNKENKLNEIIKSL